MVIEPRETEAAPLHAAVPRLLAMVSQSWAWPRSGLDCSSMRVPAALGSTMEKVRVVPWLVRLIPSGFVRPMLAREMGA